MIQHASGVIRSIATPIGFIIALFHHRGHGGHRVLIQR